MQVRVQTVINGVDAIAFDDGQAVFEAIHPALKKGETVELDFDGVEVFASSFFNAAIGQLLRDMDADSLRANLRLLHLNPVGGIVAKRVVDNAKLYYGDPKRRNAVEHVLGAMAGDAD